MAGMFRCIEYHVFAGSPETGWVFDDSFITDEDIEIEPDSTDREIISVFKFYRGIHPMTKLLIQKKADGSYEFTAPNGCPVGRLEPQVD